MAVTQVSAKRARNQKRRGSSQPAVRAPSAGATRSVLIGLLLWSFVLFLFYAGGSISLTNLAVGQRAPDTILATSGFRCPDLARTELMKRQAADEVLPVFSVDAAGLHTATRTMGMLFERIEMLQRPDSKEQSPETVQASMTDVLLLLGLPIPSEEALALAAPGKETAVMATILKHLRLVWNQGIVSERERDSRFDGVASRKEISILHDQDVLRGPVALDDLLTPSEAIAFVIRNILKEFEGQALPESALDALFRQWFAPNLRYAAARTDALRAEAKKNVPGMELEVSPGATIVEAGDVITPQVMEMIRGHAQRHAEIESPKDRFLDRIGHGSLLLLGLIVAMGLIRVMRPDLLGDARGLGLMALLSLLTIAPAKLLLFVSATTTLIPPALIEPMVPLGLAPLLGAILIHAPAAIILGVWTSLAVSTMYNHSFSILMMGLLITVVAAGSAREVRKRSRLLRIGVSMGLAAVAVVLCLGMLDQQTPHVLMRQVLTAFLSGLVSAFIAAMLIPLFEYAFRITTDITLLELSDMGHPILQRLAMEAPGTYHHSLMVANLAQSAAERIRANGLLIRVCAYFHDIGKMTKPEFFAENIQYTQNPHDDLSPNMSALVLISHVKEGIAIARRYQLPAPILDGIEQHHGTSLIYYFYHRALQQHEEAAGSSSSSRSINEEDFRYAGPRPQTPEMGILLLADSVEAASRSMEKPNVTRIESLVNDIVDGRLRDGQLDECDLTFAQLAVIKQSFVFTLTNMLHGRVAYPKHEDRDQQSSKASSGKHPETETLQPVAHGAD